MSKNLRSYDPPQSQYQNYLQEKPQKSYLTTTKNLEYNNYKPLARTIESSFDAKQTPTNPSFKPGDFADFSNNKNSSKSLNKDLKYSDMGIKEFKKDKDADLSIKLKDKRDLESKFTQKYEKPQQTRTPGEFLKEKLNGEDKRYEKKYEQYLKDSPEKISDRKKIKTDYEFKTPFDDVPSFKKPTYEELGVKKKMDAQKDLEFWNEKLEKYGTKGISSHKTDTKKPEPKVSEKPDLSFQKGTDYINELKKSLYKDRNMKPSKMDSKMEDLDRKFTEKMKLNFDEKSHFTKPEGLLRKEWALEQKAQEKERPFQIKQEPTAYSKYEALKPQKPEISAKKPSNEDKYRDLIKPSYQESRKLEPDFTKKPFEQDFSKKQDYKPYEKKLLAEEKPDIKNPKIYQQMDLDRIKRETKETVEAKSHDSAAVETLKKRKDELEIQVRMLTEKLSGVQKNDGLKHELQETENRLKEAQRELYELKNKIEDCQKVISGLNNQLAEAKQGVNKLENERRELKTANERLERDNQEVLRLQNEMRGIKAEIAKEHKLKESLLGDLRNSEERRKQAEAVQREAGMLAEELKNYKDRLDKSEKAKMDLNTQLKSMSDELTKAKKRASETGELDQLKNELEKIKAESQKAKSSLQNQLQNAKTEYEDNRKGLEKELENLRRNNEKAEAENKELGQHIGDLNEQYNRFVEEFTEKEQEYLQTIEELKNQEGTGVPQEQIMEILTKYQDLEKEHMGLLEQANEGEEVRKELANLKKSLKDSKEHDAKMAEDRKNYENIIRESEESQKSMQKELKNLNEEVMRLKESNKRLTQENERILGDYEGLQQEAEELAKIHSKTEEQNQKLQEDNSAMAEYLENQENQKKQRESAEGLEEINTKLAEMEENHQREIEQLKQKNERNESEIEELHYLRQTLEKLVEEKAQNEQELEGKLQEAGLEKAEIEEELHNLKTKFELAVKQLQQSAENGGNQQEDLVNLERIRDLEAKEIEYHKVIEEMERTIGEQMAQIQEQEQGKGETLDQELKEKLHSLQQEIENKEQELQEREHELQNFELELQKKEQEVHAKEQDIHTKEQEVYTREHEAQLRERDIQIKAQEVQAKAQDIEAKAQEIGKKEQVIHMKAEELEKKEEEIERKVQDIEKQKQETEIKGQLQPAGAEESKEREWEVIHGESEEKLNRYITLTREKDEQIQELNEEIAKRDLLLKDISLTKEKNEQIQELNEELAKRDRMLKETIDLVALEYEEKHQEVLLHEREKLELQQEKYLRKLEALRQENEVFREHIMNNPGLLENKENKQPKTENLEQQTLPFLIEEYEYKHRLAMDAEREKFKNAEEKYIKKVQELQELLLKQPNFMGEQDNF